MTSREEEFAGKLKTYLDRGAAELRPGLAYRLQAARAQALARLTAETASSGALAGAHGLVGAGAGGGSFRTGDERALLSPGRIWVAVGVLALAILGWQQWTAWQELAEVEDIDAQILSSDLPIDALVDRGFHLFLEIAPTIVPPPQPDEAAASEGEAAPPAEGAVPPAKTAE